MRSEKTPVAVNCCVVPFGIDGVAGVTEIEESVAAVTVMVVEPEMVPWVAEIVAVPTPAAVARPSVPMAFEMVAMALSDEPHVTAVVSGWVVLSV